jgi:hypothetical protein
MTHVTVAVTTMLPQTLLCLVLASSVSAQQSIALNSVTSFSGSNLPSPAVFSLPSSENLTVSVALCSDPPANQPKFIVSNDSSGTNSWEIQVSKSGFASWTSRAVNGGTLQVENAANLRFEVGVSDNGRSSTAFHHSLSSDNRRIFQAHIMKSYRRFLFSATQAPTKRSSTLHHSSPNP